jgi:hypothetical protein
VFGSSSSASQSIFVRLEYYLSRLNATKPTSGPAAGDDHAQWFAASYRAVREMKADGLLAEDTKVPSSKYVNNLIEQDHRNIKSRTNVMLGFKRFRSAATTIVGIELMQRIRKGQFNLFIPGLKDAAAPAVWNAVLFDR